VNNAWRRVVAALARQDRREAYAKLVLGLPVDNEKALRDLQAAGLVDGTTVLDDAFADLLADDAPIARTGIDRFVRNGRISQYPAKPSDRAALLEWAANQVLAGEKVDEATITERLGELTDDPASLRRYLVDADLVARAADGSSYSLNPAPRPALP
jgi:hypothetical protein